ncbi:MAG TPA: hypothetical protein VK489_14315 [Ferruginibacter sp.]|nr:hypothetical protein [Ferruginibacter sp.]
MVKGKISKRVLSIGMASCFSFCASFCFGQDIQTSTDKKDILIGEQVALKIKAVLPAGIILKNWFIIPDSIPHFDIVETGKLDSLVSTNNLRTFEQTIVFTSFDSGRWVFPSLNAGTLQTDPVNINVGYAPADSSNQLRDIKPIISVSYTDYLWYYIAGAIVLLIFIIVLLYRYWKKNRKLKPAGPAYKLAPYEEAIQEIKKLSQYNLQNPEEVKSYHTKLSDIFKRYLGRRQNKNLLNKTTSDLLIRMRENKMIREDISVLATTLRCSDAVKFAKYLPPVSESEECMMRITATINLIEQQAKNSKP